MKSVLHITINDELLGQIQQALDQKKQNEHTEFRHTNGMWVQKEYQIRKDFMQKIEKYFYGKIENVDFKMKAEEACQIINKWVEEKTNSYIKNLISKEDIDEDTKTILVNTIYFNGKWLNTFNKAQTKMREFTQLNGTKKEIKMMHKYNSKAQYAEQNIDEVLFTSLTLPYKDKKFNMIFLLPKDGSKESMTKLGNILSGDRIQLIIQNAHNAKETVVEEISIPVFKVEYDILLNEILQSLGMKDAFDVLKADFSGMTNEKEELYISKVIHKAVVDINEEATEMAAATGVHLRKRKRRKVSAKRFILDRPFFYLLTNRDTNEILCMGKFINPN